MNKPELIPKIVNRLKSESGLILLHHNADVDSIGSAIALQAAFPNFSIGALQKISQLSRTFLQNLGYELSVIDFSPDLDNYDTIVILDASSPSQFGISKESLKDPIIIDHHTYNDLWNGELYYCDDSKTSCAEIILDFLKYIGFKVPSKVSLALLGSILVDTGHFRYANQQTFVNFAYLMDDGNHAISEIFGIIEGTRTDDIVQRIAHLKGAQRLKFRQVKGFLIVVSQLSSFEASMCKQLIMLGADVVFVGSQRDEQVRISGRATAKLIELGLHLGKLFQEVSSDLNCDGGGHAGAAGLNGVGEVEMYLNACIDMIVSELQTTKYPD